MYFVVFFLSKQVNDSDTVRGVFLSEQVNDNDTTLHVSNLVKCILFADDTSRFCSDANINRLFEIVFLGYRQHV